MNRRDAILTAIAGALGAICPWKPKRTYIGRFRVVSMREILQNDPVTTLPNHSVDEIIKFLKGRDTRDEPFFVWIRDLVNRP